MNVKELDGTQGTVYIIIKNINSNVTIKALTITIPNVVLFGHTNYTISKTIKSNGVIEGRHRVGFVWFLLILQGHRPPEGGRCASCSTVLGFLLGGIRCDRLQDLQEFLTIRGTIQQSRCNFESHDKM